MLLETIIIVSLILIYIFVSDSLLNFVWKWLKIDKLSNNNFLRIFYNTLLFSLFVVTVVSIIITKGKTIFVFLIPVFYFLLKNIRKQEVQPTNENSLSDKKSWLIILFISFIAVVCSYYFILKVSIRNDVAHYVKISEYLIGYGIENPYHYYNAENPVFKGISPYHYFEMWFGGIFFKLNSLFGSHLFSNYLLYIYVCLNFFRVLVIIGIFGLISKYTKFSVIYFFIVIPILIIDISAFCNWGLEAYVPESNFFERPNFIFYYLFSIPVFDSILNNNRGGQIIWSSIFIISSITAVPAIAGALLLKLSYDFIKKKNQRKDIFLVIGAFLLLIFLIAFFYKLFGVTSAAVTIESLTFKEMLNKTLSIWKACVYMFTLLSVKIGILIALVCFLISKRFSKEFKFEQTFKSLLIYISLLCFTGIALFQLVPYLDNMYQFAFIGYCAVVLALILILTIKLSNTSINKKFVGFALFFILIFMGFKRNMYFDHILFTTINWNLHLDENFLMENGLSYKYINELKDVSTQLRGKNGASLIDEKDAIIDFLGLRHSVTYQLGNYLMVFNNNVHLPLLSDPHKLYPDVDTLSKDYYKAINFNKKTLFYRNYKMNLSYKENLSNYIRANDINFMFASKSANPNYYFESQNILKIIKDSNKGHQLILFKSIKNK